MPMARAPRRRRPVRSRPPRRSLPPPNAPKTRFQLLTYAFSKLPPRQLPFLALYAYVILHIAEQGWIDRSSVGKAGAAIVGVLSMVTGLLLGYRFSSAVAKWDEGKQVWVEVRSTIRDGIRMLSIPQSAVSPASPSASTPIDLGLDEDIHPPNSSNRRESTQSKEDIRPPLADKVDELAGLLVGFAFALQHHLQGSRPLPQAPLCDLLPPGYLLSLKRTEARVRFAEAHAGPSGSGTPTSPPPISTTANVSEDTANRPGLRRRSTGPPTAEERTLAGAVGAGALREKAEEAVTKLAESITTAGLSSEGDIELRQQLNQLNIPENHDDQDEDDDDGKIDESLIPPKMKSNLHSPYPTNLPLVSLKLMEAYVLGLSDLEIEKGGWSDSKRERGLGVVKTLNGALGEAERLSSNPPPLPLTLHLSHLLIIYLAALPCSLLCVVEGKSLILITLIAGWCLLGLEALIGEVGGVFGISENHHALPRFTQQILLESLDISPSFMRYYKSRLVARLGEQDEIVSELDRRNTKTRGEEWSPSF